MVGFRGQFGSKNGFVPILSGDGREQSGGSLRGICDVFRPGPQIIIFGAMFILGEKIAFSENNYFWCYLIAGGLLLAGCG